MSESRPFFRPLNAVTDLVGDPPDADLQRRVETTIIGLGMTCEWKRAVGGGLVWQLEVRGERGSYTVEPDEGQSWESALQAAGLL